jgi:chromosomal replication initiation ATPase DnaA
MGLRAIGQMFNRDHGTAVHGLRKVTSMIKTNEVFKKKVEEVCSAVEVVS